MIRVIALGAILAGLGPAFGGDISGIVVDPSGSPLSGARVTVSRADLATVATTQTSGDGRFRFSDLATGTYSILAQGTAFSQTRRAVELVHGVSSELTIQMALQPMAAEVTVTAETSRVEGTESIAQRVNVVTTEDLKERVHTTVVDSFGEEPGVDAQRTVPVMGGVAVRGLLGKNVAVYRDGVRYTTSAQRGGVSTFFNLNDPANLESLEVLRGPNSAQYGSDSLGGTVNFLSRPASLGSTGFHGEVSPFYSSAAHAFGGNLLTTWANEKIGITTNLISRRVNTLHSGNSLDSHAAVSRFLGLPSTVLGDRLQDTAFTQYGGMFRTQVLFNPRQQLIGHYERSQQDGGKRSDQLLGGDGNLIADLRNLMLDFGYLRYSHFKAGWLDQVSAGVSYNTQREERVNQGGNGNPLGAITHQYERTKVWGANFYGTRRFGRHDVLVGGDGYWERMVAPAFVFNPVRGTTVDSRPRIPDGARYLTYGLYVQDAWEPFANGRLRLSGALRFGGASYRSRAENSPAVDGKPLWPDDSAAVRAITGRIGAVVRLTSAARIHGHYSRGFRAPAVTDLGTVGLQGNGAYEVAYIDLAGRDATIGDRADDRAISTGTPVQRVHSEFSDNYDFGFSVATSRVRAEVTGFWINLKDAIVSQTLILPQGAVGQPLGDQIVTRQLPTGVVFVPLSTAPVLTRGNLGRAEIYGIEQVLEAKLTRNLLFAENLTWIYMRDVKTGLAPDIEGGTPPLTVNVRLRYNPGGKRFWAETYGILADRQDRLSSLALADRRTGATRSRANIASFFNNGAAARGLVSNGVLVPTGETVTQVQNRVLGTANSAPMFTAIPGYGLVGVRGGLRLTERSDVFVDFSNVFDQMNRGVSWGSDGAGRGLTLKYLHRF